MFDFFDKISSCKCIYSDFVFCNSNYQCDKCDYNTKKSKGLIGYISENCVKCPYVKLLICSKKNDCTVCKHNPKNSSST